MYIYFFISNYLLSSQYEESKDALYMLFSWGFLKTGYLVEVIRDSLVYLNNLLIVYIIFFGLSFFLKSMKLIFIFGFD